MGVVTDRWLGLRDLAVIVAALVLGAVLIRGCDDGLPAHAQEMPQAPHVMAGQYRCAGANADGTEYELPLTVFDTGSGGWQLTWKDREPMIGLGYFHRGVLSVSIASGQGQAIGLAVYDVIGSTLDGSWLAFGSKDVLTEKCVPAGAREAHVDGAWACDNHPRHHIVTSEADMREYSLREGCRGWHKEQSASAREAD